MKPFSWIRSRIIFRPTYKSFCKMIRALRGAGRPVQVTMWFSQRPPYFCLTFRGYGRDASLEGGDMTAAFEGTVSVINTLHAQYWKVVQDLAEEMRGGRKINRQEARAILRKAHRQAERIFAKAA